MYINSSSTISTPCLTLVLNDSFHFSVVAVIVCTPSFTHENIVKASLNAGMFIFSLVDEEYYALCS